jgi:hypothetical protein
MAWIALDANILVELCCSGDSTQRLQTYLEARRNAGDQVVIAPQVVAEVEQANPAIADRLLHVIAKLVDGVLGRDSHEMMREFLLQDPYDYGISAPMRDASRIEEIRRFRGKHTRFLQGQLLGNEVMRRLLPEQDRALGKAIPGSTFRQYADERHLRLFQRCIEDGIQNQWLQIESPDETELRGMWRRSLAWRVLVMVVLANEFRSMARLRKKAEGCMTDLRQIMECAYVDTFITRDVELFECGALLRNERTVEGPRFTLWQ